MKVAYRSDIDGLRAIAVLAVLGFHAFPNIVRGGFIGVDIFFVISGFLISGLIKKDLEQGTFGLANFYARRAKRIFPALIAVCIACLALGWLVLLPDELSSLGEQVGVGAAFVANLALLQEVGYFETAAELKPLLHLWSLGVEEQFYIIWPLLILLSWRSKAGPLIVASGILAVSFAWNVRLTATDQAAAFYLPVTRFWELMLGCLLAFASGTGAACGLFYERLPERGRAALRNSAAWLGAGAIAVGLLVIERENGFPGWRVLLPALGALLLISAGAGASINRRLLSHPALVYIGLISYPLYLWHWPILAFERIVHVKEPNVLMKAAGLGVAFLLAAWTYKFVEKPIRFGPAKSFKPIAAFIVLGLVGGMGMWIHSNDGFRFRVPDAVPSATAGDLRAETDEAYRTGKCFLTSNQGASGFASNCEGAPKDDARSVLLWGDSHAAHLFPGLHHLEQQEPTIRVAQYTASGCPPVLLFSSANRQQCASINDFVSRRIELLTPKIVIMAARWELYQGPGPWGEIKEQAIPATVMRLKSMGVERVLGIGQFPIWQAPPSKIQARLSRTAALNIFPNERRPVGPPTRNESFLNRAAFEVDRKVSAAFNSAGTAFISPAASLCNEDGCLLVVPDSDELLAWDTSHLTKAGSIFFIRSNVNAIID